MTDSTGKAPLGVGILSALFILGGGLGLLVTLFLGAGLIDTGLTGLAMVIGLFMYSAVSILVGHWLSNLEKKGYYGAIWLLMIGAAISIAPIFMGGPSNVEAAIIDVVVAGYLFSKKGEFVE